MDYFRGPRRPVDDEEASLVSALLLFFTTLVYDRDYDMAGGVFTLLFIFCLYLTLRR